MTYVFKIRFLAIIPTNFFKKQTTEQKKSRRNEQKIQMKWKWPINKKDDKLVNIQDNVH